MRDGDSAVLIDKSKGLLPNIDDRSLASSNVSFLLKRSYVWSDKRGGNECGHRTFSRHVIRRALNSNGGVERCLSSVNLDSNFMIDYV